MLCWKVSRFEIFFLAFAFVFMMVWSPLNLVLVSVVRSQGADAGAMEVPVYYPPSPHLRIVSILFMWDSGCRSLWTRVFFNTSSVVSAVNDLQARIANA